jgi:hypothetical protein
LKLARNTAPAQLRGILETINLRESSNPAMVVGYFGILPDANFCSCSSIQASITLRMPVSTHWSQAFSSLQYQP